jgi:hypothetical protein
MCKVCFFTVLNSVKIYGIQIHLKHSVNITGDCLLGYDAMWSGRSLPGFGVTCCLHLKEIEAADSSTILVMMYKTAWNHIPEDNNLYGHCCENLKSCIILLFNLPFAGK